MPPDSPIDPDRSPGRTIAIVLSLLPALVLVGAGLALVVFSEAFRGEVGVAWGILVEGDVDALREWLLSFGAWAPAVSAMVQIATSVFPPGPSFLLGIANAMMFGLVPGALLTLGTQMVAAGVCFGIARVVGRPGVERLVSPERLARVDGFMERRGVLAVFVGRVIPFINPDLVSYAAGVTGISWTAFLLAVGAGGVPSTIFYSIIGATAIEATGWVLVLVGVGSIVPLLLLLLFRRRFARWLARQRGTGDQSPPSPDDA